MLIYIIGCESDIDCYYNMYLEKQEKQDFEYSSTIEANSFEMLFYHIFDLYNENYGVLPENYEDFCVEFAKALINQ